MEASTNLSSSTTERRSSSANAGRRRIVERRHRAIDDRRRAITPNGRRADGRRKTSEQARRILLSLSLNTDLSVERESEETTCDYCTKEERRLITDYPVYHLDNKENGGKDGRKMITIGRSIASPSPSPSSKRGRERNESRSDFEKRREEKSELAIGHPVSISRTKRWRRGERGAADLLTESCKKPSGLTEFC